MEFFLPDKLSFIIIVRERGVLDHIELYKKNTPKSGFEKEEKS